MDTIKSARFFTVRMDQQGNVLDVNLIKMANCPEVSMKKISRSGPSCFTSYLYPSIFPKKLPTEAVDISEAVCGMLSSYETSLSEKQITLSASVQPRVFMQVHRDTFMHSVK